MTEYCPRCGDAINQFSQFPHYCPTAEEISIQARAFKRGELVLIGRTGNPMKRHAVAGGVYVESDDEERAFGRDNNRR